MTTEIKQRLKYREVTHGKFRSPASISGITRLRMEKTPAQRREAEAQRKLPVPVMYLLPNGKCRMRKL